MTTLELNSWRIGGGPPAHVVLSPVDHCNHNCSWCAFREDGQANTELFRDADGLPNPRRFIPADRAMAIIAEMGQMGVAALTFSGGGEPTLHREFPEMVRVAHRSNLRCGLITNGVSVGRFSEGAIGDLARQMSWVRVSVDAATPETYSLIRRVQPWQFDSALGVVRLLVKAARDTGCVISLSFVACRENWREMLRFTETAKSLGVAGVRLTSVIGPSRFSDDAEFASEVVGAAVACEALRGHGFFVTNRITTRMLSESPRGYSRCYYQELAPYIGADMKIYRCCNTAYTTHGLVADLSKITLAKAWFDPSRSRAAEEFDARRCGHCFFDDKNQTLRLSVESISKNREISLFV